MQIYSSINSHIGRWDTRLFYYYSIFCPLGISFYISKLLAPPACPAATDSKTLFLDADANTYGYILGCLRLLFIYTGSFGILHRQCRCCNPTFRCFCRLHVDMYAWGFECMNTIAFVVYMPSDDCTALSLFKVYWLLKSMFFLLN